MRVWGSAGEGCLFPLSHPALGALKASPGSWMIREGSREKVAFEGLGK